MYESRRPQPDEVDQLLRNAELRDELERYFDESISRVNIQHATLAAENEFLACMLAWEQAPVLPIYRWFDPEMRPPRPESLGDRICKRFFGHGPQAVSKADRIGFHRPLKRQGIILPDLSRHSACREKKIEWPNNYLHWDCTGPNGDPEVWLRYYATDEEREDWGKPTGNRCLSPNRCLIRAICHANRNLNLYFSPECAAACFASSAELPTYVYTACKQGTDRRLVVAHYFGMYRSGEKCGLIH